jgi:putative hemolysin
MVNIILLILLIISFILLAGFFAGAETGIYQLSRLRLRLGLEKKKLSFVLLDKSLRDSTGLLISLLIGTNLAYYLTTSIVTYIVLSKVHAPHTAELIATLLTAPVLFVFAEVVPKSLFFYRADSLMPYVAPVLLASHRLFTYCGAVPALKALSGFFARFTPLKEPSKTAVTSLKRHEIAAILEDTHEEGFLSPVQSDIIKRLVVVSNIRLNAVMIPLSKVQMLEQNSGKNALLGKLKNYHFTRLPVYDRWPENIIGFVNIYEVLSSTKDFLTLQDFIKPVRKLPADTPIIDAINIMQNENQKIVLVTTAGRLSRPKAVGIVTMKDLVEQLLGELAEW